MDLGWFVRVIMRPKVLAEGYESRFLVAAQPEMPLAPKNERYMAIFVYTGRLSWGKICS